MKKIMLCVLVAALVVTTSQAQEIKDREPGKHHMMKKHHGDRDLKSLNLTEDQKAKFKILQDENRKQMAELKKNDNITVKEWKSKMEAQRKEHRAKVQSLLTDEQKTKLEKSRQNRSKARLEKMKTNLGLSDEQSAKLKSNHEAMAEKMKAIREDKNLNEESKKEQVKELKKKQKENMKSILTEEQLKKLEEQKHQRASYKKNV